MSLQALSLSEVVLRPRLLLEAALIYAFIYCGGSVPDFCWTASRFDLCSRAEDRISSGLAPNHRPAREDDDLGSDFCVKFITEKHFSMVISLQSQADREEPSPSEAEKIREKSSIMYAGTSHTDTRGTLTQFFFPWLLYFSYRTYPCYCFPTNINRGLQSHLKLKCCNNYSKSWHLFCAQGCRSGGGALWDCLGFWLQQAFVDIGPLPRPKL